MQRFHPIHGWKYWSYSDDAGNDDFYNDEDVEIISEANDENNPNQEPPMPLAQTSPPSQRTRNNVANSPLRKFKHVKPSMMNVTVDHNKSKTDILNETKDELRKLASTNTCVPP